jgi:hypothetical protein
LSLVEKSTSELFKWLFNQAAFPDLFRFMMCIFSETVNSECPSGAVMCKEESVEGLSVEIASDLMQKKNEREREDERFANKDNAI